MIKQLEVDGVPTLVAPATGPMHAGLAFRVGLSDETLARFGVTHLVEHLALHSAGVADYHYNGTTGTEYTYFHLNGSEADIVAFLNGVCTSLRNLPLDRLAIEKEILRTEANGRRGGVTEPLALWRHGARDFGLPGYAELGLPALTAEDLQDWVARYFTRENAALWIAGDSVPAGLELSLPSGVRRPVVAPSSALAARPAYFSGSSSAVAWDSVLRREARTAVFAGVLEREMFRSLRQTGGLSYTVQTDYEPRADGSAVVTAVADALPEKQEAVLGGFIDVLAATRVGRIDPADVTTMVNRRCEALVQAEEQGGRLPGQAFNLLTGRPVQSVEEAVAEVRAVTADDVAAVAADAWDDGLLMTPRGTAAEWAGFVAAPTTSESVVAGTTYPALDGSDARIIVGDQGVSLIDGDEQITVRFDACAVMLAWPDGARQLIGHDAIVVRIEPTLFANAAAAVPWVDARVPAGQRIDLPARDPERIPVPEPPSTAGSTGAAGVPRGGRTGPVLALVALVPVASYFGVIALLMGFGLAVDTTDLAVTIFVLVFSALCTAAAVFGILRAVRRLRR
jgi:predicted Zn-dependent peptidase